MAALPPLSSRPCRCFAFTVNNPNHPTTKDDILSWAEAEPVVRYTVFQLEVGAGGTEHYQGYLELNKPERYTWVHRNAPVAMWIETARIPLAAENYAMKEDTRVDGPWTAGARVARGRPESKGDSKKDKFEKVKEAIKEGASLKEIMDLDPVLYLQHPRAVQDMVTAFAPMGGEIDRNVYLFYGPTGTGKSRWVRQIIGDEEYYAKPKSTWWNRYDGQTNVILDDFGAGWAMPLAEILGLLDRYDDVMVQPKGGYVRFAGTHIYFTSNQHPYDWFNWEKRELERDALARRFKAIYFMPEQGVIYQQTDPAEIKNFFADPKGIDWKWE